MKIKKFNKTEDYEKVINFLKENYKENKNMLSWLPQRFDDLIYRIDVLYHDERGKPKNADFIYLFINDFDNIIGIIIPDGDSFNTCIKDGYEEIFSLMLDVGEKELRPLFTKNEDGTVTCLVVSHDRLKYQSDELLKRGYIKEEAGDFDNVAHPLETNYTIELPAGFRQIYGEGIEDGKKYTACHYGFHPTDDNGNLTSAPKEGSLSYQGRKNSQFFKDSFESMIVTEDGDICSYCFCYVDKETSTAFIEPVSTREKYRHKGFAKQMLYGVINRLKEMNIENAYINSYDWRRKVYNSAGFQTEDSISFWHKRM